VLADLARQRATARFIATKLVRHFVADDPPPAAVERVAHAFLKGGGDLPTVYAALIEAPEAWDADMRKFKHRKTSCSRLGGRSMCRRASRRKSCTASTSWVSVNIRRDRLQAGRTPRRAGWVGCPHAPRVVGLSGRRPLRAGRRPGGSRGIQSRAYVRPETVTALRRASSSTQALALLLMSPEFQRR